MNDKPISAVKQEREKALALDRRRILGLDPEKALDAIAGHPYPVTLIQSMADEDLYFLVHHIGPDDALPVLALASNQQWEYLLDLEGWDRDRPHPHHQTQWLARLLKADPDRFTHWIINQKQDETVFYLFRNIQVHIREYDQDPAEIGDDYFSEDQTYYVRLRPYPKEQKPHQQERDLFVRDLLNRLSVYDYTQYRDFLLAAQTVIPAEAEEELFRLRTIRLAERGLLPFDEAVGVYQPLKPEDLLKRGRKSETFEGRIVDAYPFPIDPQQPSEGANLFARCLAAIHDMPSLHRLQAEFAGLCNQVIAADQQRIRQRQVLEHVVRKVGDYISIGLEKMTPGTEADAPYVHASLVQQYLLADLFRVGYGCALALKWRVDRWHRTSWYAGAGLPLSFWGETFMGVLGGLLLKRPLYFNRDAPGSLYREFATLEEIEATRTQVSRVIAFDDLLSLMALDPSLPRHEGVLTYENLMLTLWANHHLNMGGSDRTPQPLTREQFSRFFAELWQPGPPPRRISNTMRELFLDWLAARSGLASFEISERMASALEHLFGKIESELGGVRQKDLDPRFIPLFLLSGQD